MVADVVRMNLEIASNKRNFRRAKRLPNKVAIDANPYFGRRLADLVDGREKA